MKYSWLPEIPETGRELAPTEEAWEDACEEEDALALARLLAERAEDLGD